MSLGEREFLISPIYRDARGYIWQRLRNGSWHCTDGVFKWQGELIDRRGDGPPGEFGPYTLLIVGVL